MYEITRGFNGRRLTVAQRTSSKFAEEPLVLGKVLRRGAGPIKLTDEQYEQHKPKLNQLEKAGAIVITKLEEKRIKIPASRAIQKNEVSHLTEDLAGLVKAAAELENGIPAIASKPSGEPVITEEAAKLDSLVSAGETAKAIVSPEIPQESKPKKHKKDHKGDKEG